MTIAILLDAQLAGPAQEQCLAIARRQRAQRRPGDGQLGSRCAGLLHAGLVASGAAKNFERLFALGNRASAEAIRERLINPPSYSAVRAMLVRLENKGHIRHHSEGARYIYSAKTSPAAARRDALRQYLRTFFGGSLGQMVTTLVRQETWTDEELDALRAEIDLVRKGGRRS